MKNNLRREDAERIIKLVLAQSKELDEFLEDIKHNRSEEEVNFIKKMIGKLKGAIYFEVIELVNNDFKDITERVYSSMSDMRFEFPDLKGR